MGQMGRNGWGKGRQQNMSFAFYFSKHKHFFFLEKRERESRIKSLLSLAPFLTMKIYRLWFAELAKELFKSRVQGTIKERSLIALQAYNNDADISGITRWIVADRSVIGGGNLWKNFISFLSEEKSLRGIKRFSFWLREVMEANAMFTN